MPTRVGIDTFIIWSILIYLSEVALIFGTNAVLDQMVAQGHTLRTSGSVKLHNKDEPMFM